MNGRIIGLGMCALALMSSSRAEEILVKQTTKFLGWQTSPVEFTTCAKHILKIETGRVLTTAEKCQDPGFVVAGGGKFKVMSVDSDQRVLGVVDEKGTTWNIFYPKIAEEKPTVTPFEGIKPGLSINVDWVKAKVPTNDRWLRAETITQMPK